MIQINTEQARWTELELYFLVTDLLLHRQKFSDVTKVIDACNMLGSFELNDAINLAKEILTINNIRPSKEEFIIIAQLAGMPTGWILKKVRISKRKYTSVSKRQRRNPMVFHPKLTPEQLTLAEKIVKAFKLFRKVGAPDANDARTLGYVQELRTGSFNNESLRLS